MRSREEVRAEIDAMRAETRPLWQVRTTGGLMLGGYFGNTPEEACAAAAAQTVIEVERLCVEPCHQNQTIRG